MVDQRRGPIVMDLLAFFEQACAQGAPGDRVDTLSEPQSPHWLHTAALAKRLGFEADVTQPGVYVNRREGRPWVLRWVQKSDFPSWHALFRICFGHDMSQAQWFWKYRDADTPGVAVMDQGHMVAFYGGMPRPLLAMGKPQTGIQVGDVMVHPDFRGSLSRKGPFQMAASTFLEQSLSKGAPYWVGFGFPNTRAMQVAERLKLYRQVDEVIELSWDATTSQQAWWQASSVVSPQAALPHVEALWSAMQTHFNKSVLGVRDAAFMQSRYAAHPSKHYECVMVRNRLTRQIQGLAVCKLESDGRLEIMDLLGSPLRFANIVSAVRQHAAKEQRSGVFMWITQSHHHLLSRSRPTVSALNVSVPSNCWVSGNTDVEVDGQWWLTGGDTDFR
jgi:hypothetical protein